MRPENEKSLERLSLLCHVCGLFSVFLGLVVAFIDLLNNDMRHIQIGIYVFFTGYALVKISSRISKVLFDENDPNFIPTLDSSASGKKPPPPNPKNKPSQ